MRRVWATLGWLAIDAGALVGAVLLLFGAAWTVVTLTGVGAGLVPAATLVGGHVVLLVYAVMREHRKLAGWLPRNLSREAGWGVAGAAAMLGVGILWSLVVRAAGFEVPDVPALLRESLPEPVLLAWGAGVVPVAEEVYFRGRLIDGLTERAGRGPALAIMALAFAAAHGIPEFVPAYVTFALMLAWLRERTGGLVAPIVAHSLNNLVGLF